jgi:hypothetical protein
MVYNRPTFAVTLMPRRRPKPKFGHKAGKPRITKLKPSQAAARDEGPRLIPLRKAQDTPKIDHWVELADKALSTPAKKKGAARE